MSLGGLGKVKKRTWKKSRATPNLNAMGSERGGAGTELVTVSCGRGGKKKKKRKGCVVSEGHSSSEHPGGEVARGMGVRRIRGAGRTGRKASKRRIAWISFTKWGTQMQRELRENRYELTGVLKRMSTALFHEKSASQSRRGFKRFARSRGKILSQHRETEGGAHVGIYGNAQT